MGWFGTGLGNLARNVPATQPITDVLSNLGSSNDREDYAETYLEDEIRRREQQNVRLNRQANQFYNRDSGTSLSTLYDPLYGMTDDASQWMYGGDILQNEVSPMNTGNTWEGEDAAFRNRFSTSNMQGASDEAKNWWDGLSGLHQARLRRNAPSLNLSTLYSARSRMDPTQLGQQTDFENAMRAGENQLYQSGLIGGDNKPSNLNINWIASNEDIIDAPEENDFDTYGPMIGNFLDSSNFSFDTDSGTWRITGGPGGDGIGFTYEMPFY